MMEVGSVVVATNGYEFVSGCGWYPFAICVSVEPFVMVSEHGDMKWSCFDIANTRALCQAHPDVVKVAMDRHNRDLNN